MSVEHTVDLMKELVDLFNREEMLAFFDFQFDTGEDQLASGLCKISRPKENRDKLPYFSLLMIIDTPDNQMWRSVDSYMKKIQWDMLQNQPEIEWVLPMPPLDVEHSSYFKQTDISLGKGIVFMKPYILDMLLPAVKKVTGFSTGEVVFWEELDESKIDEMKKKLKATKIKSQNSMGEGKDFSFIQWMKSFFEK